MEFVEFKDGYERGQALGSTDISAIIGVNPFQGAWDSYSKLVEGSVTQMNEAMKRGVFMEQGILDWYGDGRSGNVEGIDTISFDYRGAKFRDTPDGVLIGDETVVLEAKCVSPRAFKKWRHGPPEYYLAQCQYHLGVCINVLGFTEDTRCDLIAFDGHQLHVYPVQYNKELFFDMLNQCVQFWHNHVVPKIQPEIDGSDACSIHIKEIEHSTTAMLTAEESSDDLARQLSGVRKQLDELKQRERIIVNALCETIGGSDGIQGLDWTATWKPTRARTKTDWEAVAKSLGAGEELIRKHSRQGKSTRRFYFRTNFNE